MRHIIVILAFLGAVAPIASADDRSDVMSAVNALLAAYHNADAAGLDQILHRDFRLTTLQERPDGGGRDVGINTRAELIAAMRDIHPGSWNEHLSNVVVGMDRHGMANVWADYVFDVDGRADHCGNVSLQLYRTGEGWKIITYADTHNPLDGHSVAEICPR